VRSVLLGSMVMACACDAPVVIVAELEPPVLSAAVSAARPSSDAPREERPAPGARAAPAIRPEAVRSADGSVQVWREGRPGTLWIARGDGSNARVLLDPRKDRAQSDTERSITLEGGFYGLELSPDAKKAFFIDHGWIVSKGEHVMMGGATSRSLFSVEIETGKARYVLNANGFTILHACKDAALIGSIVAYVHSYDTVPTSAYDWLVLVDQHGRRIGDINQQPNLDRFLAKRCGIGTAPPDPPPVDPESLRRARASCPHSRIEYRPRKLLDGTTLDLFVLRSKKPSNEVGTAIGLAWLRELCP
jgi:hypothetical protein